MSNLFGDWARLDIFLREAPAKIKAASEVGSNRAGALLAKRIKQGLRNQAPGGQAFKPLSRTTKWGRIKDGQGTKALIASGALLRSVTWKKIRRGVWVGSNRRDKSGKYNLADIHEKGRTIKVTENMRKYGLVCLPNVMTDWTFRHLKSTTKYIHIPARPFIGPVASDPDVQQEIKDEYVKAIQEVLRP